MILTDLIVQRTNAHPYKHEDVYDVLIQGDECALSRGRAVLDESGVGHQVVAFDIPYMKGIRLGQIVEVEDLILNTSWRGKIIGIGHKLQIGSGSLLAVTNLKVKKPSKYFVATDEM